MTAEAEGVVPADPDVDIAAIERLERVAVEAVFRAKGVLQVLLFGEPDFKVVFLQRAANFNFDDVTARIDAHGRDSVWAVLAAMAPDSSVYCHRALHGQVLTCRRWPTKEGPVGDEITDESAEGA
jgi:hypothetical protein